MKKQSIGMTGSKINKQYLDFNSLFQSGDSKGEIWDVQRHKQLVTGTTWLRTLRHRGGWNLLLAVSGLLLVFCYNAKVYQLVEEVHYV